MDRNPDPDIMFLFDADPSPYPERQAMDADVNPSPLIMPIRKLFLLAFPQFLLMLVNGKR